MGMATMAPPVMFCTDVSRPGEGSDWSETYEDRTTAVDPRGGYMDGERRWGDAMTRVEAWKFLAQVLENSQTQTYAMFLQRAVENAGYQKGEAFERGRSHGEAGRSGRIVPG